MLLNLRWETKNNHTYRENTLYTPHGNQNPKFYNRYIQKKKKEMNPNISNK